MDSYNIFFSELSDSLIKNIELTYYKYQYISTEINEYNQFLITNYLESLNSITFKIKDYGFNINKKYYDKFYSKDIYINYDIFFISLTKFIIILIEHVYDKYNNCLFDKDFSLLISNEIIFIIKHLLFYLYDIRYIC